MFASQGDEVLPNANHLFFTDQPERTNDILLDWLARHRDQPEA